MDATEFKKQFNLLYNNINNNAAPGLKDKEIEMFLNKAQDEIVKQHVMGLSTNYQVGINQASKRDVELDSLIKTCNYVEATTPISSYYNHGGFIFELEEVEGSKPQILVELAERMIIRKTQTKEGGGFNEWFSIPLDIVELSYAQLNKFMSGVYKYPKKNQCWKIRHDSQVEVILPVNLLNDYIEVQMYNDPPAPEEPPAHPITWEFKYMMTYVSCPPEIDITSVSNPAGCSLPETIHPEILQRAVELAKAAYASQDVNVQMTMGQRSE